MTILADDDLLLGTTSGGGVGIYAGALHGSVPNSELHLQATSSVILASDNSFMDLEAATDIWLFANSDVTITGNKGNVELHAGDRSTDQILLKTTGNVLVDALYLEPWCGIYAPDYDIWCDTLYYSGGSWPDFLDDVEIVKQIKTTDGKHLDIDSLHPYLRIDKQRYLNRFAAQLDKSYQKARARLQDGISKLQADKVGKSGVNLKKLENEETSLQERLAAVGSDREQIMSEAAVKAESLYKTCVPANSMISLALALTKQLVLRVEELERKVNG
jgi:hypothetical protein